MPVARMPAVEVEIGEEEHQQGAAQHRFGTSAIDVLDLRPEREEPADEAEINAEIDEDRPCQGRRGRKDQSRAQGEHDGEEDRQKAGNAGHDAAIERQSVELVLVDLRVPQGEFGQARAAQFGHEGDNRAGFERDREEIGLGAFLALRAEAMARRDRLDSHRGEIRPEDPRAGQLEARGHEHAFDGLVRIVLQREGDPARAGAGLAGLHLDAAHDAIRVARGLDFEAILA